MENGQFDDSEVVQMEERLAGLLREEKEIELKDHIGRSDAMRRNHIADQISALDDELIRAKKRAADKRRSDV